MSCVIVDVESDGPIPAEFPMVCFGARRSSGFSSLFGCTPGILLETGNAGSLIAGRQHLRD
jgi:hypothetical protein